MIDREGLAPHSSAPRQFWLLFPMADAVTESDVLLRRVPVALGGCWSPACSREAAARVGAAVGWKDKEVAAELEAFEVERSTFLRKPALINPMIAAVAD